MALVQDLGKCSAGRGVFTLFGMLAKVFEELEEKWSVAIYRDQVTHPLLNQYIGYVSMIEHSVFSVMAGLIVEMLFMLFSVYNTV